MVLVGDLSCNIQLCLMRGVKEFFMDQIEEHFTEVLKQNTISKHLRKTEELQERLRFYSHAPEVIAYFRGNQNDIAQKSSWKTSHEEPYPRQTPTKTHQQSSRLATVEQQERRLSNKAFLLKNVRASATVGTGHKALPCWWGQEELTSSRAYLKPKAKTETAKGHRQNPG